MACERTEMAEDMKEEAAEDREKVKRNLFGTTITNDDRRKTEEDLQEMYAEGARKLSKYEILQIERILEKPEKPPERISSRLEPTPDTSPEPEEEQPAVIEANEEQVEEMVQD